MAESDARISPTAHYTGYVWFKNGLSDPCLASRTGRNLYHSVRPFNALYKLTGGPTLESMLLARHAAIDAVLGAQIEAGRIGQVVEIAAGLSPRGLRFRKRFPHVRYVEGDLEGMAGKKTRRLSVRDDPMHHVVHLDALIDVGPESLGARAAELLDPTLGTAVITEGLINYFPQHLVEGLWGRIARVMGGFPGGLYLSDVHLADETFAFWPARFFVHALTAFARGSVHMHYKDAEACRDALSGAGFERVRVQPPAAYGAPKASPRTPHDIVRVICAEVGGA